MGDLDRELHGRAPQGLEPIGEDGAERLAELIAAAKRNQAEALDEATIDSLGFLPSVLRAPLRKMLFK